MTAAEYTLPIQQGATFTFSIMWEDDSNTPIDLTGYQAKFQIRDINGLLVMSSSSFDSTDDTAGCEIVLGGAAGTITVTAPESLTQTALFSPATASTSYRYGLSLKSPGNITTTLLSGQVQLLKGVVQWP